MKKRRRVRVGEGGFERANPLPPGRYWIDLHGPERLQAYFSWRSANSETVKTVATEGNESAEDTFVVFQVLAPTERWSQYDKLGLPTRAGPNVSARAHVSQRSEPLSTSEYWLGNGKDWTSPLSALGSPLVLLGLVWFLSKRK